MKSIWQGTLSFGLVNIPITLFSAIESQTLGFTLLCSTCNRPISYKRWCTYCQKEVTWNNIVKGLKIKKDTYFVLTKENIHKLKPTSTDAIEILEFVSPALIEPLYLEKHYYLLPKKTNEKGYFLFMESLGASQKVAVGVFVMREKEHVCIIYPYHDILLLTTLNYDYEIKKIDSEVIKNIPKITDEELDLAIKIIDQLTKNKFDMSKFKDCFAERLAAVLKKSGKAKLLSEEKQKKLTKNTTLFATLEASLKKSKTKKTGRMAQRRK